MEVLWILYLTVCSKMSCITQEVQSFNNVDTCIVSKQFHEELPKDGHWSIINYECRPEGSMNA